MKKIFFLVPPLAVAAVANLAQNADAANCNGIKPLTSSLVQVNCPAPNTNKSGLVRGSVGLARVGANLTSGTSITVVGRNQNGTNLTGTCAVRDDSADGVTANSPVNSCIPNDPGEVFTDLTWRIDF